MPKGTAEDFVADLDCFFILKNEQEIDPTTQEKFANDLTRDHPFCVGLELGNAVLPQINFADLNAEGNVWPRFIKTQSVCVRGTDLSNKIRPFKLQDMIHYSKYLRFHMEEKLPQFLKEDENDPKALKSTCSWAMRLLLRSGYEICMFRENRWTNDLYLSYETLSKFYPSQTDLFRNTLHLSLNPVSNVAEFENIVSQYRPWIYQEIIQHLDMESSYKY